MTPKIRDGIMLPDDYPEDAIEREDEAPEEEEGSDGEA